MQQNFGSSPHLPQAFNAPVSAYSSRPPSRDPYQQQQQHHPHQHQHQHQQPMQMSPMQYVNEHGQYMSPPAQYMQPQSIYSDNGASYNNHSPYGAPPPPQYQQRNSVYDEYGQPANHFYLHESPPQPPHAHPQRRTWAHSAAAAAYEQQQQAQQQQPMLDVNAWQTQKKMQQQQQQQNWPMRPPSSAGAAQGFVLHQNGGGGGGGELQHLFPMQSSPQHGQRMQSGGGSANGVQRQQSLTNLRDNRSPKGNLAQPMTMGQHEDMMAPQSICFIGDEEDVDELERNIIESMQSTRISDFVVQQQQRLQQQQQQQQQMPSGHSGRGSSSEDYDSGEMISNKLNITSGNLTYRLPSPSRPLIQANSFQDPRGSSSDGGGVSGGGGGEDQRPEKGFYISFDNDQPKRPKPPLRAKRSPKKEANRDSVDNIVVSKRESLSQLHNINNSVSEEAKNASASRHSIHGLAGVQSIANTGNATYNKYTDEPPIQLRQMATAAADPGSFERRHLEDLTNQPQQQPLSPTRIRSEQSIINAEAAKNKALVIGADAANLDPVSIQLNFIVQLCLTV